MYISDPKEREEREIASAKKTAWEGFVYDLNHLAENLEKLLEFNPNKCSEEEEAHIKKTIKDLQALTGASLTKGFLTYQNSRGFLSPTYQEPKEKKEW